MPWNFTVGKPTTSVCSVGCCSFYLLDTVLSWSCDIIEYCYTLDRKKYFQCSIIIQRNTKNAFIYNTNRGRYWYIVQYYLWFFSDTNLWRKYDYAVDKCFNGMKGQVCTFLWKLTVFIHFLHKKGQDNSSIRVHRCQSKNNQ